MFTLRPIGYVNSSLVSREQAPKQSDEGAPAAWLVFEPAFEEGLRDLHVGDEILVVTWLDRGDRQTLRVRPRNKANVPLRGVFSTRSPDRPNPIGIHRTRIVEMAGPMKIKVSALEALDGTPVIDIKPVLGSVTER